MKVGEGPGVGHEQAEWATSADHEASARADIKSKVKQVKKKQNHKKE